METLEEKLTKTVDKLQKSVKWTLSICVGSILLLIVSVTTLGGTAINNSKRIDKINDDYLPYFAFQYMLESNQRLIDILIALPVTTKDDPRYLEVMNAWNKLQNDIARQAGLNKRSAETKQIK